MKVKAILVALALTSVVGLVMACESDTRDSSPTTPTSSGKLSANNASAEELEAAIEAAGISNAEQWAYEIEEYRPYSEEDVNFSELWGELQKYNPGPGVVEAIIDLLELP